MSLVLDAFDTSVPLKLVPPSVKSINGVPAPNPLPSSIEKEKLALKAPVDAAWTLGVDVPTTNLIPKLPGIASTPSGILVVMLTVPDKVIGAAQACCAKKMLLNSIRRKTVLSMRVVARVRAVLGIMYVGDFIGNIYVLLIILPIKI
jgi:hypothetical protein